MASMFENLLKTPEQIREEQRKLLQERSLTNATLMSQGAQGASTALPGLLKGFGATVAQNIDQNAADLVRGGLMGIGQLAGATDTELGAKVQQQAIQASIPQAEREAMQRQALISQATDVSRIDAAIERARANGDAKLVQYLEERKAALDKRAIEKQTALLNNANIIADIQSKTASTAKVTAETDIITRTADATVAKTQAEAESAQAKSKVDTATVADNIRQVSATLAKTQASTTLDVTKTNQTIQAMQQAGEKFPAEMELLKTQADQNKAAAAYQTIQANRVQQLTPLEVAKIAEETKLLGSKITAEDAQAKLRLQQLAGLTPTEFQRDIAAALKTGQITQEDADRLTKQRLQGLAATAGVGWNQTEQKIVEAKVNRVVELSKAGAEASRSKDRADRILAVLPDASTGKFASVDSFVKSWMGQLGFEGAQATTAANELIQILNGELTLDKASAMKGALSDKDVEFLKSTIAQTGMSVAGIQQAVYLMAAQYEGEAYAGRALESMMSSMPAEKFKEVNVDTIYSTYKNVGRNRYFLEMKQKLANSPENSEYRRRYGFLVNIEMPPLSERDKMVFQQNTYKGL